MNISLDNYVFLSLYPLERVEEEIKKIDKQELEEIFLCLLKETRTTQRLYLDAIKDLYKQPSI